MQKSIITTILFSFFAFASLYSQSYPDFTITDSDGNEHTLYQDYLDQGKSVVIKVFFVACPPCNAIAPSVQELYEEWGEGQFDVQFFELSVRTSDSNSNVATYKNRHNLTFPGAGNDGGSLTAVAPLLSGDFGPYYGTPSFAVIAPDGTVTYPTPGSGVERIPALSRAIADTGATGMGSSNPDPSTFTFNVKDVFDNDIDNPVLTMESQDGTVSYPVDISNPLVINDIATEFPGITTPYFRVSKTDDVAELVSALDIFVVVRHILSKELITDPLLLIAGDADGDNALTALDLFTIQRVILRKDLVFPNLPSFQFPTDEIETPLIPGQTQNIKFIGVKTGDLNGF